MNKICVALVGVFLMAGCSSDPIRIGTEYGWYCNDQYQAVLDKSKFKKISIPGVKEDSCIQMRSDQDAYWDFQLRDYEANRLPGMPELQ